jgi:hypothetical protein
MRINNQIYFKPIAAQNQPAAYSLFSGDNKNIKTVYDSIDQKNIANSDAEAGQLTEGLPSHRTHRSTWNAEIPPSS